MIFGKAFRKKRYGIRIYPVVICHGNDFVIQFFFGFHQMIRRQNILMPDIFPRNLLLQHPDCRSHICLLCGFQGKKYHRILPHITYIFLTCGHNLHAVKIVPVIQHISNLIQLLLKKGFQHVQRQCLSESSRSCKKAHITLTV